MRPRLPILALFTFRPPFEPPWAGLANVRTLKLGRLGRDDPRGALDQRRADSGIGDARAHPRHHAIAVL